MSRARPSAGWADDPEESSGLLDGRQRAAFPAGRGAPFYKRAVRVVLPFPLFVLAVLAAGVFFHVADPYIWGAAGMSESKFRPARRAGVVFRAGTRGRLPKNLNARAPC